MPLFGGVLIGISSSTMLGGIGRITGISGIIGGVLRSPEKEDAWRFAFLIGLIGGGFLLKSFYPSLFNYALHADEGFFGLVLSGLLVGYGTRTGGGCTSGHGVCGLARTAKRSFVAVLTFILFGMLTATLRGLL